jgi:hypothetical protein
VKFATIGKGMGRWFMSQSVLDAHVLIAKASASAIFSKVTCFRLSKVFLYPSKHTISEALHSARH